MNLQSTKKLNNGVEIPVLGLGVWQSEGDEGVNAVRWALEAGYRHIDTAAIYGNEAQVAEGIRRSGVPRKEVFVTTKLWNEDQRLGRQRAAFEDSLKKLGTDYVDLYLIHWPVAGKFLKSWKVMEELYAEKKIRAIGVSNFHKHHLDSLLEMATVKPVVNQIELSPRLTQMELTAYCKELDIAIEPWSPLGGTGGDLLRDPVLGEIAGKYGKSPAQVVLRWILQKGYILIPKSVHKERIESNADIFDFELSAEDSARIDAMNKNQRTGGDPDNFNF